jgi:hypothetical protein
VNTAFGIKRNNQRKISCLPTRKLYGKSYIQRLPRPQYKFSNHYPGCINRIRHDIPIRKRTTTNRDAFLIVSQLIF